MKRGEEAIDVGVHVDSHALNESFPMVKETFYNNNKTTRNIPFPFAIDIKNDSSIIIVNILPCILHTYDSLADSFGNALEY